jgi:ketosteroid isomerase-like protein
MGEARAVVERFYAAFNRGDLAGVRDGFDPNVVTVEPSGGAMRSLDAFAAYLAVFMRAVPDAKLNLLRAVESGDTVAIEGTYTGTFTGPLASPQGEIPPTGKAFDLPYVEIFDLRGGKATTHHIYYDQVAFLGQLGLMPPPAG